MAATLLGNDHVDTEVQKIIDRLAADDKAFYDPEKDTRKVPVFKYDADGKRIGISFWSTRRCAPKGMKLAEAQAQGLDFYVEERGWIRAGKKAEKDISHPRGK